MAWEKHYVAAKAYYEENGHLLVSISQKDYRGVNLGVWISNLRSYYKHGVQTTYLTPERIRALEEIGMVWSAVDYLWERNYYAAVRFHREHGHLDVPANYVDGDGIRLGVWIFAMRSIRRNVGKRAPLTEEQIRKLDALDMLWGNKKDIAWVKSYQAVCAYRNKHGHIQIPTSYETEDGLRIGRWLRMQREVYAKGNMPDERKEMLDRMGMVWQAPDPWMRKFQLLEAYYMENGHTKMPADYVVEGVWLSRWLSEQILRLNGRRSKCLTAEQQNKLASVGILPTRSVNVMREGDIRTIDSVAVPNTVIR